MPEQPADTTVTKQVALAVRKLDSLSILPSVAAQCFSKLLQFQSSPLDVADVIESDPVLAAKFFSLMHEQGVRFTDGKFSFRDALDKLPAHIVRDAVLSIKVYSTFDEDEGRSELRKQLILHSLAVACCAEDIARIISPQVDSELAYSAGLLHNIGAFALDQAMPRSFISIVEQAKLQKACLCAVERKHLGIDHTILGKRLAARWHLPVPVSLAIWLHHSDTNVISQNMPEAGIAQIVQVADSIVCQSGIGQSGSYDVPHSAEQITQSLAIDIEQLEQIHRNLADKVTEKSKILGLDLPRPQASFCDIVHTTAAKLARDNTQLSHENRRLQTTSGLLEFTTDFLLSINSNTAPIDIAENFAVRWQRFYQTGMVCLYLTLPAGSQLLEAVVVESSSQCKTVILNAPAETPAIPQAVANTFAVLDAQEHTDWLFEQLDVDFDLAQTKLVPLLSIDRAVGVIVFELRYPAEAENLGEKFEAAASVAGAVLDMAFATAYQQRFAEQFARLVTSPEAVQPQIAPEAAPEQAQPKITAEHPLDALAEMAGGAAHELNNPLSVISGRAQLLAESEDDPEKKKMLEQIQQNTAELSAIIDDLMSFAEPPQPRSARTDVKQLLDEAIQLTALKQKAEQLDIQIDVADGVENVFVDSAQIVSALANIFSNSLESYEDGVGPVKVTAAAEESGDFVKLQISDSGCGMDAETLQKATRPFFSAKPAGRKRGMGLAHAQRIIKLNNGSLNITSQPGTGTTVTILLPCK
jgi:putative nucleotidyltransferase with HDIG domain